MRKWVLFAKTWVNLIWFDFFLHMACNNHYLGWVFIWKYFKNWFTGEILVFLLKNCWFWELSVVYAITRVDLIWFDFFCMLLEIIIFLNELLHLVEFQWRIESKNRRYRRNRSKAQIKKSLCQKDGKTKSKKEETNTKRKTTFKTKAWTIRTYACTDRYVAHIYPLGAIFIWLITDD